MRSLFIFLALFLCATAQAQNVGLPNDAPTLPSNLYTTPSYIGGSVTTSSVSAATTKVIYANDPIYGGAKFNRKTFLGNTTNTQFTIGTLKELDNSTTYNPLASGVVVGDYIACASGFSTGGTTDTMTMLDGTVSAVSATQITSTVAATNTGQQSCLTGSLTDQVAVRAAFAASLVPPCKTLVFPDGGIVYSSLLFNNNLSPCPTRLIGQGGGMNAYQGNERVGCGTTFTPTNNFVFTTQTSFITDNTNNQGELGKFCIDALGFPGTDGGNSRTLFILGTGYNHELTTLGWLPTNGTPTAGGAAMSVSSAFGCQNCSDEASTTCLLVGTPNAVAFTNFTTGNCTNDVYVKNAGYVMFSGGFWDESSTTLLTIINTTQVKLAGVTMLAAAGGFGVTVDGTSNFQCNNSTIGIGAFAQQAVSIASGGKMTASNCTFYSGNSTTNASIVNNGTITDLGGNVCSTQSGTANNSGGTIPGGCVANGGNQMVASLTHSVTNFVEGVVNLSASSIGTWTPDQNITVTRIQAINTAGNVTCATPLVLQLSNGTTTQTLTLTSGAASWDTGVVSKLFVSGTAVNLTQTAAGACATPPVNLNVSILWQAGSGT